MTPEQAIGNTLVTVDRIRRMLRTKRLTHQIAGSIAMDQLRDAGYVVVRRDEWQSVNEKAERWIREHGTPAARHEALTR